jgi:NADH-quinone oxidoreductase subunit H
MRFGWKVLVPVSLLWILVIGAFSVLNNEGYGAREKILYVGLPIAALLLLASMFLPDRTVEVDEEPAREPGGYPTPPMDLVVPPTPRIRVRAGASTVDATTTVEGKSGDA